MMKIMSEITTLNLQGYPKPEIPAEEPVEKEPVQPDPEFQKPGFWERRLPQSVKDRLSAGLMLGLTLLGPRSVEAQTSSGLKLKQETQTTESWKWKGLGAHFTFFAKGEDGQEHFNPWSLIAPGVIEWNSGGEKGQKVGFELPYEYSRLFDTGKPLNPEDHDKIARYIDQKLKQEFADQIHSLQSYGVTHDEDVYQTHHPEEPLHHLKITDIAITGAASPEGPAKEGPATLAPGHIDDIPEPLMFGLLDALRNEREELDRITFEMDLYLKNQDAHWKKVEQEQQKAADTLTDQLASELR